MKLKSTSAAAPDMDWQNLQMDQYGNVVDSYDDYADHYNQIQKPRYSADPLLDAAMLAMDSLTCSIGNIDKINVQLDTAKDIMYMLQDMRTLIEDARWIEKEGRKLRQDLYASIDRENTLSTQKRGLEEKLNIVKNSDIRSMRRLVNIVKQGSNNDKVESVEERGPKITFNSELGGWPGDGPIEEWEQPF